MKENPSLPFTDLRDLFEYLDHTSTTGYPCDHSFALTKNFLQKRDLPMESTLQWLGENGAGCDCEVAMNVAEQWGEIVGYVPSDEDL